MDRSDPPISTKAWSVFIQTMDHIPDASHQEHLKLIQPHQNILVGIRPVMDKLGLREKAFLGERFWPKSLWIFTIFSFGLGWLGGSLGSNPKQNLLYNPFSFLVLWQCLLLIWLAIQTVFLKKRPLAHGLSQKLMQFIKSQRYLTSTRDLWLSRIVLCLHLAFIGFCIGVILNTLGLGLVRNYQFYWESTWVQESQAIQTFLNLFYAIPAWLGNISIPEVAGEQELVDGKTWLKLQLWGTASYLIFPRLILVVLTWLKLKRWQPIWPSDRLVADARARLFPTSAPIDVQPYSYNLSAENTRVLQQDLTRLAGRHVPWQFLKNAAWESEPDLAKPHTVILFRGSQTPELEIHGQFVEHFPNPAIVVDLSTVAEAQKEEQQNLWISTLPNHQLFFIPSEGIQESFTTWIK